MRIVEMDSPRAGSRSELGAAARRLATALEHEERARRNHEHARGTLAELPTFADLVHTRDRVDAREQWLRWCESDYPFAVLARPL